MSAPTLNPVVTGPPAPEPGGRRGQRALAWTGGVVGAAMIALCAVQVADLFATSTESRDHDYPAAEVVELAADGAVVVDVGGDEQVLVTEHRRTGFGGSVYTANRTANDGSSRLAIENVCDRQWWSVSCEAGLTVTVPVGTAVVVRSTFGDITVSDIAGPIEARTEDGRVTVVDADGDVVASSDSGDVQVDGVRGNLTASTSHGAVEVARVSGDVVARSNSGDVTVDGGRQVAASTSDGAVAVTAARGAVTATSGSGDVDVEDVTGDVEARSSDGGVTVRSVSGHVRANSGSGRVLVGAARGDVEATSSDGAVTVHGPAEPVALTIATNDGRTTVEGPTDPTASRTVVIRSGSGNVAYLGPR
ncbi:DUF4097 family beta strand repeat-containing protein [Cellulomonas chengniuliangii]|uniref:DUF4097 domain-containing protein n=1 Tax=Cellulomonas chengniuliangii TaxID=2968084 RepID=A0ABY5L0T2_9CELL|nr:DUF4097 family beta strand repeat-containing protein [Cellulomonas chengniuliangii]MCC2309411.1 DUF4097 domain-containing protein [Cellulomonas chengniuliangii]UUI75025.1 DUF4097 domain-containing protein [Cellulomonas chengniuliangii]